MPKKPPKYCLHRASGHARVRLDGKDIYLGDYDSPDSHDRYNVIVAKWLTKTLNVDRAALTLARIAIMYVDHARDIIDILTNDKTQIRIRLTGIDAPEKGQPWGSEARQFLSGLVAGMSVRVVTHGEDQYGRTIGDVWFRLETLDKSNPVSNVNFMMVANGRAWHYAKDAPDREDLASGEQTAREIKRALWSDPEPIAPWHWQELSKEGQEDPGTVDNWSVSAPMN